jgi:hypothetical protein
VNAPRWDRGSRVIVMHAAENGASPRVVTEAANLVIFDI